MLIVRGRDIVRRCKGNPLITIDDLGFRCADVCNAGAIKTESEYILLLTIQTQAGFSIVYPARSTDGYTFDVSSTPLLERANEAPFATYENQGVLDPRVTYLEGTYYIVYDALSDHGYRLALASTKDFESVERLGLISEPDTKAGALFPRKLNGKYARLERPWAGGSIWVSYSDDLRYWGWSEVVMTPRGGFWDASRIGVATPPMEMREGWLFVYYGIKDTSAGPLFRLGAAILDPDEPHIVKYRTNVPILAPREEYERIGDVPNLVFSCGAVLEPNGEMKLYYGAANSCICVGTTKVDDILAACQESDKEF
ncbi:MAG TPA: glycosidase [Candidatus Hydrogenedentes bacterium]|nr:glycosidase [Candidatus Hydrogenedentota bacterium]HIJ73839.1 glycosidase [Candidatus Hydrogenedentota bacterium]